MTKLQITGFNFERELPLLIFYIILKENYIGLPHK